MNTIGEIGGAIRKLSATELEEFRAWFEEFLEERYELTEEVKAKLDQSSREIASGSFTVRQPN